MPADFGGKFPPVSRRILGPAMVIVVRLSVSASASGRLEISRGYQPSSIAFAAVPNAGCVAVQKTAVTP